MKNFTKIASLLVLVLVLGFSNLSKAQCSANFIWSNWASGVVGFTSTSVPVNSLTTYYWNFGNGATYTAMGNAGMGASYQYTANGTYTVTLFIITVPTCSNAITQTISVNNALPPSGCNLNAGFSNWLPGGPGNMNFTNNSTGTVSGTTYTWNYGDNTSSNGVNGSHTYAANGNYWVTLWANNNTTPACVDSQAVMVVINTICNLSASFSYTQGNNGLVNFQSTSTNTISGSQYYWSFGDGGNGSGSSTAHTYTNGTYNAVLTVVNNSATCTSTATQAISVTSNTCNLTGSFTFTQGTGGVVNFNNTSTGTTSASTVAWNLGNGYTSASNSPSTTYLSAGVHLVTMTVSNGPTCSSVLTQSINITGIPCVANANFSLNYGGTPGFWNAVPAYPWNVVAAQWSWGDATNTNSLYTSHQYSVSANYNICLTVTVSCGATASTCSTYSIYRGAAGAAMYQVNAIPPQLKDADNTNLVGIKEVAKAELAIGLYPNPAREQFALMVQGLSSEKCTVTLSDALGRTVITVNQKAENGQLMSIIDVSEQPAGVYFLSLQSGDQQVTRKIVVTK